MLLRRLLITGMLVVFLCSSLIPSGIALGGAKVLELWIGKTQVNLDGVLTEIDVAPFIADNRTMVPIRVISESFGARVEWFNAERKVMIYFIGKTIVLWIGEMSALVNGQQKYLDAPPLIIGDRTFVPIRFISENIGGTVGWDQAERKVTISFEGETERPVPGYIAPDFSAETMNGEAVSLHDYLGCFVVLNFWSIDSEPSRLGISELNAFYDTHFDEVAMLSIEEKAGISEVEAFMRDYSVHYPIILDQASPSSICNLYQIDMYPMTVLIDPTGKVVERIIGRVMRKTLESLINKYGGFS